MFYVVINGNISFNCSTVRYSHVNNYNLDVEFQLEFTKDAYTDDAVRAIDNLVAAENHITDIVITNGDDQTLYDLHNLNMRVYHLIDEASEDYGGRRVVLALR